MSNVYFPLTNALVGLLLVRQVKYRGHSELLKNILEATALYGGLLLVPPEGFSPWLIPLYFYLRWQKKIFLYLKTTFWIQ